MALENVPRSTVHDKALPRLVRQDAWWAEPAMVVAVLLAFTVYVTFRAFENDFYLVQTSAGHIVGNYLSPFYSPLISTRWMLFGKHISPAIFILPFPLVFRATCYYYRKAYYRAFFGDPTACAVPEAIKRPNYTGEREFPFTLQNLHRYAFYFGAIIVAILWYDAALAFTTTVNGATHFYVGLGSLIFLANIVLLSLYTFSCHSFRHLTGGCVNCFSCSSGNKARHGFWQRITHWNENHQRWAWLSLFSVMLVDFYVRCLATGAFHDIPLISPH